MENNILSPKDIFFLQLIRKWIRLILFHIFWGSSLEVAGNLKAQGLKRSRNHLLQQEMRVNTQRTSQHASKEPSVSSWPSGGQGWNGDHGEHLSHEPAFRSQQDPRRMMSWNRNGLKTTVSWKTAPWPPCHISFVTSAEGMWPSQPRSPARRVHTHPQQLNTKTTSFSLHPRVLLDSVLGQPSAVWALS